MRRLGDGTTRISSRVPDAAATRFATYLEAFTNPRRRRVTGTRSRRPVTRWRGCRTRSGWARRSSSSSSPSTPPGSRSTAGTPPRSWSPSTSTHSRPTSPPPTSSAPASSRATTSPATASPPPRPDAWPAPRRSCPSSSAATASPSTSAAPAGSSTRSNASRWPSATRQCRAEGCDVPATWCEAHHLDPWQHGGHTDLADGVLLCSHHHHRVHDARYRVERSPGGTFTFHLRR